MTDAPATSQNRTSHIGEIVALIARTERTLLAAIDRSADERLALELTAALRDLAAARLKLEGPQSGDSRRQPRFHETAMACLTVEGGRTVQVEIIDVSAGGAQVRGDESLASYMTCRLKLDGLDAEVEADIRRGDDGLFHLLFRPLLADRQLALTKHLERSYFRV